MSTQAPDPQSSNDEKLLDHDYDGIQELDNPLPKWWVQLFIGSIIFSFLYIGYFWFGPGLSLDEQLEADIAKHSPKDAQTEAVAGEIPSGEDWVSRGEPLYISKCASCHGGRGEGLIGPNLTDEYVLHGDGSLETIYDVIVKGVPSKGMIAWEALMKPDDIAAVANYVKSLQGTQVSNGKAPQGQKISK